MLSAQGKDDLKVTTKPKLEKFVPKPAKEIDADEPCMQLEDKGLMGKKGVYLTMA